MLSIKLQIPLLTKDDFKELLADSLNVQGTESSAKLGASSFEILFHVARRILATGGSIIFEGNFDSDRSSIRLNRIVRETDVGVVQVLCRADGDLLLERYRRRGSTGDRHPIHLDDHHTADEEFRAKLRLGQLAPLDLEGQIIQVDTSDLTAIDVAGIVAKIRQFFPIYSIDDRG